jgi:hypothetical protein
MNKNGLWTILKKQLMIGQAKDTADFPYIRKFFFDVCGLFFVGCASWFVFAVCADAAMNKNGLWTILKKQLMIGQAKDGEKPKLTKYHYINRNFLTADFPYIRKFFFDVCGLFFVGCASWFVFAAK